MLRRAVSTAFWRRALSSGVMSKASKVWSFRCVVVPILPLFGATATWFRDRDGGEFVAGSIEQRQSKLCLDLDLIEQDALSVGQFDYTGASCLSLAVGSGDDVGRVLRRVRFYGDIAMTSTGHRLDEPHLDKHAYRLQVGREELTDFGEARCLGLTEAGLELARRSL